VPAVLLGAVLSAASDADSVKHAFVAALLGAFSSGFGAIGGHHALKAAPGPYGEEK
jgi:2C-methyl-D-erythritol 2,4-cyclodiphosphate synthase